MKRKITELAEIAIDRLNESAMLMHRQMQSGELDKPTADKSIRAAQIAATSVQRAYFSRKRTALTALNDDFRQKAQFENNGTLDKFQLTNERFGKVLKHYAKAVGAELQTT